MTENKRFILVEYVNKGLFIQDNANDETQYFQGSKASLEKVVNLLNDLSEENEQSKSIVKEVIELLSEEVDVFSDKATEHDINAYIELKELDNKDAYYMATATKKVIKLLKEVIDDR